MKRYFLFTLLFMGIVVLCVKCGAQKPFQVLNSEQPQELVSGSTTQEEDVTPAGEKSKPCYVEVKIHPTAPGGSVRRAGSLEKPYRYYVTPPPQGGSNVFPGIDFTFTLMGTGCDCAESNIHWYVEGGEPGNGKTYVFFAPRGMGAGGQPATVLIDCYCGTRWLLRIELIVSS